MDALIGDILGAVAFGAIVICLGVVVFDTLYKICFYFLRKK